MWNILKRDSNTPKLLLHNYTYIIIRAKSTSYYNIYHSGVELPVLLIFTNSKASYLTDRPTHLDNRFKISKYHQVCTKTMRGIL